MFNSLRALLLPCYFLTHNQCHRRQLLQLAAKGSYYDVG